MRRFPSVTSQLFWFPCPPSPPLHCLKPAGAVCTGEAKRRSINFWCGCHHRQPQAKPGRPYRPQPLSEAKPISRVSSHVSTLLPSRAEPCTLGIVTIPQSRVRCSPGRSISRGAGRAHNRGQNGNHVSVRDSHTDLVVPIMSPVCGELTKTRQAQKSWVVC